jgi:alpha-1,3-fucosyltransferase
MTRVHVDSVLPYRPLLYDTVPTVMGGANYNKFAPPHSFINVRDFESPRDLANYLLMLNETDDVYAKYFEWKANFEVIQEVNFGLCDLCRMAHDHTLQPKSYHDIKKWWVDEGGCENGIRNKIL